MNAVRSTLHRVRWLLCLLALAAGHAFAAPEVPELERWFEQPPEKRRERAQQIREQLLGASPADREAFRERLQERLRALPPDRRRDIAERLLEEWREMSPAEREAQRAERRAYLQGLSRAERRQLIRERRELLQRMSPEERRRWRQGLDR